MAGYSDTWESVRGQFGSPNKLDTDYVPPQGKNGQDFSKPTDNEALVNESRSRIGKDIELIGKSPAEGIGMYIPNTEKTPTRYDTSRWNKETVGMVNDFSQRNNLPPSATENEFRGRRESAFLQNPVQIIRGNENRTAAYNPQAGRYEEQEVPLSQRIEEMIKNTRDTEYASRQNLQESYGRAVNDYKKSLVSSGSRLRDIEGIRQAGGRVEALARQLGIQPTTNKDITDTLIKGKVAEESDKRADVTNRRIALSKQLQDMEKEESELSKKEKETNLFWKGADFSKPENEQGKIDTEYLLRQRDTLTKQRKSILEEFNKISGVKEEETNVSELQINPKTGEKIKFNRLTNKWEPYNG